MLEDGFTIVDGGVGIGSIGANAAPGSTVPEGAGDVVATRRVGAPVVVVRRDRPVGGAVGCGALGGGPVTGGFVVGGVVLGGVVVGGIVVSGNVVAGNVVAGNVVDGSAGAMGPGESRMIAHAAVAASTNAPPSRRRIAYGARRYTRRSPSSRSGDADERAFAHDRGDAVERKHGRRSETRTAPSLLSAPPSRLDYAMSSTVEDRA